MTDILVVGLSARSLAESARRSGYAPLAADMFCDLDLEEHAERCVRIEGDLARGIEWRPLYEALTALSAGRMPIGIVCGTGFEDRPHLLDKLAERWPLVGNSGDAVRRANDPEVLSATCDQLGIPHPELKLEWPFSQDVLRKLRGGAGGSHVSGDLAYIKDNYFVELVPGEPVSVLVLGTNGGACPIGLSSQGHDPTPDAPFRYGGAVRPADVSPETAAELEEAACRMVEALDLVGLNSVDFLVADKGWHGIEVNPRPGATLDIFDSDDAPLFALHVAACRGELPDAWTEPAGASASCIVYAKRNVENVPHFEWPDWAADRQRPGTRLAPGDPLCTVLARAATAKDARRLVEERGDAIFAAIGAG